MRFYVKGEAYDLDMMCELFPEDAGSDEWFGRDDDGVFFARPDTDAEPGDSQRAAVAALARMVGLGRVLEPQLRAVTLNGLQEDASGNRLHVIFPDPVRERSLVFPPTVVVEGQAPPEPPPPEGPRLIRLAATNSDVEEVLDYLGKGDLDWRQLLNVFEIVQSATRGAVMRNGWVSKEEINTLCESGNRKEVSGDQARHARLPGKHSGRGMTLSEGRDVVRRLVAAWLRSLDQASS